MTSSAHSAKQSHQATLSPTSVVVSTGNDAAETPPPTSFSLPRNTANDSGVRALVEEEEDSMKVGSPTSVTMVSSASASSLLPAASVVTSTTDDKTSIVVKPFFVMDWLEDVNPRDLELARKMLQTPTKKKGGPSRLYDAIHRNNRSQQHEQKSPPAQPQPGSRSEAADVHQDAGRRAIRLPSLAEESLNNDLDKVAAKQDQSICRQLYPAAASTTTTISKGQASPTEDRKTTSETCLSSGTSVTSISTSGSRTIPTSNATGTEHDEGSDTSKPTAAKISPFKKRSIAIGNGWNAKGLQKAKKGNWESALTCWENALEIRTQVLGETHPDVANTCNNIGIALGKLGRFDAGIAVLERALELRAKHYGTREHVEVAATLHNIGNVLHAAQDSAGAIQCFWDAKLLQEQLLGPDNVHVARACVAIGNVYYEASQYDDAKEAYLDGIRVFSNAGLPESHAEVQAIKHDLKEIERLVFFEHHHQQQKCDPRHIHYSYQQHGQYPQMAFHSPSSQWE